MVKFKIDLKLRWLTNADKTQLIIIRGKHAVKAEDEFCLSNKGQGVSVEKDSQNIKFTTKGASL